jgi:soluble lytic murein transglycosylase
MMRTGKSHAGRVNLTKYVKVRGAASETWRFCPVVYTSNGRIRPDHVLIDGRPELHKEGAYYIEWYRDGRRYRESVGKSPSEAFAAAERKVQVLRNQALGIEIVGEQKRIGITLSETCREFLEETRQHHRPKTYSQYKTALEYFRQCSMKLVLIVAEMLCTISIGWAQSDRAPTRIEAEYYVTAYAQHYRVPVALARAIVSRESNWQPCVISAKGAVGLMQLMPATAKRLAVTDRCNLDHNISGGMRYLAWLMRRFHNDLRLVAAAYYVGEDTIGRRGLAYRNLDVVTYVRAIRTTYLREAGAESGRGCREPTSNCRRPARRAAWPTPAFRSAARHSE